MRSFFSTPTPSSVNTYIGGIPSSIVSADTGRELLQSYDNIYDTNSGEQQQITTLQNQVLDLRNQILKLQYAKASQVVSDALNWIANGDCSQFTLPQPVRGTVNAGVNNNGFILNGRAVPIMDRWYHIMEGAGFNASNFKMEAKQVKLTSYISGTPAFGTVPSSTVYGLSVKWYNPTNTNACFSLETSNTARYGGMVAVQHIVPNIRAFVNTSYSLGFWVYSSKTTKGYVRVLRQYNMTQKGGASLEFAAIQSFDTIAGTWRYINIPLSFGALNTGKTLNDDESGCVIQIGPCYYNWSFVSGVYTPRIYGSTEPFTTTSPGLEFVVAEVQLRSDVPSLDGTGFPSNLREDDRTLKYVTYVAPQKPTSMNIAPYNPIVMGTAQCKFSTMNRVEAHVPLRYASRLVKLPSMILWGYKNATAQDVTIRWNSSSQFLNNGGVSSDMFSTVGTQALDVNMIPYILIKEGDPSLVVDLESTMIGRDWFTNFQRNMAIPTMTESSLLFKASVDYSDFGGSAGTLYNSRGIPVFTSFVTNRLGEVGWFTCIVAECDLGVYNNQSEVLSYVDFTITAPTSLPL